MRTAADRPGRLPVGGSPMTPKFKDDNWQAKKKLKAAISSPSGHIIRSPGDKNRHKSSEKLSVKFPFSGPPAKQVAKKGTGGGSASSRTGSGGGSESSSTGVAKKSTARKHTASFSGELKRYGIMKKIFIRKFQ